MSYYNILTQNGQSVIDIAMSEYGHIDGAFWILEDNPDTVALLTDVLNPGTILNLRVNPVVEDLKKLNYVRKNRSLENIRVFTKQAEGYLTLIFEDIAANTQTFTIQAEDAGSYSSLELLQNVSAATVKKNGVVVAEYNFNTGDIIEITITRAVAYTLSRVRFLP